MRIKLPVRLVAFTYEILQTEQADRLIPRLAQAYARVFAGPPWNEEWSLEAASEEIQRDFLTSGFIGVQTRREVEVIGFSWGFFLPSVDQPGKQFTYIRRLLEKRKIEPSEVFYGTETGVVPERQKQGIGPQLLAHRMRRTSQPYMVFRTKNPPMVKVYQRVVGSENIENLCSDPDDPERTWYLIRNIQQTRR